MGAGKRGGTPRGGHARALRLLLVVVALDEDESLCASVSPIGKAVAASVVRTLADRTVAAAVAVVAAEKRMGAFSQAIKEAERAGGGGRGGTDGGRFDVELTCMPLCAITPKPAAPNPLSCRSPATASKREDLAAEVAASEGLLSPAVWSLLGVGGAADKDVDMELSLVLVGPHASSPKLLPAIFPASVALLRSKSRTRVILAYLTLEFLCGCREAEPETGMLAAVASAGASCEPSCVFAKETDNDSDDEEEELDGAAAADAGEAAAAT